MNYRFRTRCHLYVSVLYISYTVGYYLFSGGIADNNPAFVSASGYAADKPARVQCAVFIEIMNGMRSNVEKLHLTAVFRRHGVCFPGCTFDCNILFILLNINPEREIFLSLIFPFFCTIIQFFYA